MGSRDAGGSTPLHWACYRNHVGTATELISMGADVGVRDARGFTPLHDACQFGGSEIVLALARHGAMFERRTAVDSPHFTVLALKTGEKRCPASWTAEQTCAPEAKKASNRSISPARRVVRRLSAPIPRRRRVRQVC